jgi:RHS repeat-associated protein
VANQLTEYIYSWNDIIEETLSTVNATTGAKTKKELREYVYGSKWMDDIVSITITPYTRVNKVDVAGTSNTYYYEKDHLGSITRITTNTGWIVDEYSYTVFGKAYKKNPDWIYKPVSSLKSAINNTRLYTWREYDRETNLYYLRARYYDANLGRFISRDPIGMQDNVNLYTYVGNNSINYTDRIGLNSKPLINYGIGFPDKETIQIIKNRAKWVVILSQDAFTQKWLPDLHAQIRFVDADGKPLFDINTSVIGYSVVKPTYVDGAVIRWTSDNVEGCLAWLIQFHEDSKNPLCWQTANACYNWATGEDVFSEKPVTSFINNFVLTPINAGIGFSYNNLSIPSIY